MPSRRLFYSAGHPPSESRTLYLNQPLGKTLGLAIILFILVMGAVEGLSRLLVDNGLLPPPPIGSLNAELDVKLSLLDQWTKDNGRIDCIFLGSSQADSAIDPEAFAAGYEQQSGWAIHCFNFSLATLTAEPAGKIASILARRYQPALLVYATSARDYSLDFGEWARPLLNDPWVRYQSGQFNLRGWLIDHSYAVRYLIRIRQQTDPDYRTFTHDLKAGLTALGYKPATGNDLNNEKNNFIPQYGLSQQDLVGLDTLLRLQNEQLQVLVVEIPVHHSFLPYYVEADALAYELLFIQPITDFITPYQVQFWRTQKVMKTIIPDSGWSDTRHLNIEGGSIFSSWLGQQLADRMIDGTIEIPFQYGQR